MSDQFDLFDEMGAERPTPTPGNKIPDTVRRAPAGVVPFPLYRRLGKVHDVTMKLGATKTGRHAEFYRAQVTHALGVHLQAEHVPVELHAGEIARFWQAVSLELARRKAQPQPKGAA